MNYYPPPPWWGYGGPPQNMNNNRGMSRRELDKIARNAVRDAMRLRDKDKNDKRKRKEEKAKTFAKKRAEFLYALELYILGIICAPFIGPLYNYLKGKYGLP